MPTPPFSQDRRDWLTEISSLFSQKKKSTGTSTTNHRLDNRISGACDSVTTISTFNSRDNGSSKDQAMVDNRERP
jgi:hypothetical protein